MTRPRKPKVDPLVPTRALDRILGRTHVGTPDSEIEQMIHERIDHMTGQGEPWTPTLRRQTVRYGLWRHRANRQEFMDVMQQDPGGHEPHVGRPGPGPDAYRWNPEPGEQEIGQWQGIFNDRRN